MNTNMNTFIQETYEYEYITWSNKKIKEFFSEFKILYYRFKQG